MMIPRSIAVVAFLSLIANQAYASGRCYPDGQIPCEIDCDTEQCPAGSTEVGFYPASCVCYPPGPIIDQGCAGTIAMAAGYKEDIGPIDISIDNGSMSSLDASREYGIGSYFYLQPSETHFDPGYPLELRAAVPVGTVFYLQYIAKPFLPVTPDEGCPQNERDIIPVVASVEEEVVSPALSTIDQNITLFPNKVVQVLSSSGASRTHQYLATHYGTASVVIVPEDPYYPAMTIRISVVPPKTLKNSAGEPIWGRLRKRKIKHAKPVAVAVAA